MTKWQMGKCHTAYILSVGVECIRQSNLSREYYSCDDSFDEKKEKENVNQTRRR